VCFVVEPTQKREKSLRSLVPTKKKESAVKLILPLSYQ